MTWDIRVFGGMRGCRPEGSGGWRFFLLADDGYRAFGPLNIIFSGMECRGRDGA
jgi:hypothetical protein